MQSESYVEMRDLWADYNSRQSFKHDLLNRKTTWMLTTEGLLFAAVGIGGVGGRLDDFERIVAISGLSTAAIVLLGVGALIWAKWRSYKQYERVFRGMELHGPAFQWGGVGTPITLLTLVPDIVQPIVFIAAWGWLLLT